MEKLEMQEFDPNIEQLTTMADGFKSLSITSLDDKEGYKAVHEARMELKNTRVKITKAGKTMRESALAYQKAVIQREKELIAIIEPVELELKSKQDDVDEAKEREKRKALLPDRLEKLKAIECEISEEQILSMDVDTFSQFHNEARGAWLAQKEAAMRAEQERLDMEKQAIEQEKLEAKRVKEREAELEKAKKEAAERAKQEAEENAQREAAEAEERKAKEQAELESKKKYQAFLKKHGVSSDKIDSGKFFILRGDGEIILYQKLDVMKI